MKKTMILLVVSMLILGIFMFGENIKYGGTVNFGAWPGVGVAANFNPLSPNADMSIMFVYEPLMYINSLNGAITPMLATSYKWEDSNLKMVVTIRKDVKWNDDVPFTPNDVVFTFNLLKKYPSLDLWGVWTSTTLQDVSASGDNVIFTFSKPNVPMVFFILRQLIVPAHIWSEVKDPTTFVNADNPVGTGPFLRTSYDVANNTEYFSKNPNYWWKGRPYVDGIREILSMTNEGALLQMLKGAVDVTDIAIADPLHTWVAKDSQNNLMFWPVISENYLLLMNDAKVPFNNATFRKAISLAINKKLLEDRAYWGTGGYDISQTQIIPAQRAEWYDTNLASEDVYLCSYNPTEAQKLLESIGYAKNSAGVLVSPDGKTVAINLLVGAGLTDQITMAQNISQELEKIGIKITMVQQSTNTFLSSLALGNYDMAIMWGVGASNPFFVYNTFLNPSFSAPIGQSAISNYSRYTNPDITKALNDFMASSDPSGQKQAMYTIEKVLLDDLPMIVLTNRTGFDLYSQKRFVGWPTIQNPYCNGMNNTSMGLEIVMLNIHLK